MTTQAEIVSGLRGARRRAENAYEAVKGIEQTLADTRAVLHGAVRVYSGMRLELFEWALSHRQMTWCTKCEKVMSIDDMELLLTEGSKQYTHGYGGAYYGFRNFLHLYRACSACRKRAFDRHGWRGQYDSLAKGQSSFNAFPVEKREDAYYARKFGDWVKCAEMTHEFPKVPDKLIEQFAGEWALPPKIEINSGGLHRKDELIIHETA